MTTNDPTRPTRDQLIEAGFVSPTRRPAARPEHQPPKSPPQSTPAKRIAEIPFVSPLRRYWLNAFKLKP